MPALPGDLPIDPNVVDGTELAARLNRILPDVATATTGLDAKVNKSGDTMTGTLNVNGVVSATGGGSGAGGYVTLTLNETNKYVGLFHYKQGYNADKWIIRGLMDDSWNLTGITFDSIVGVGVTPTNRNNTSLQLASGIGFPAAQVASTDPNTLDDYEEGALFLQWVGSTSGTVGPGWGGRYTKIGNVVNVSISFTGAIPVNSLVGNISITGLPFVCPYDVNLPCPFIRGSTDPTANVRTIWMQANTAVLKLHSTATFGDTAINPAAAPTFPAASLPQNGSTAIYFYMNFSYHT